MLHKYKTQITINQVFNYHNPPSSSHINHTISTVSLATIWLGLPYSITMLSSFSFIIIYFCVEIHVSALSSLLSIRNLLSVNAMFLTMILLFISLVLVGSACFLLLLITSVGSGLLPVQKCLGVWVLRVRSMSSQLIKIISVCR